MEQPAAASRAPIICCPLTVEALEPVYVIEQESNRPPWTKDLLAKEFLNAHARVFGCRQGGSLAGYLILHLLFDEAHIINFGVRESFRGYGFGRALLSFVLEELRSQGVGRVTLEVRETNNVARCLYESVGFREVGHRAGYYSDNGEDAIVMALQIAG